MYFDNCTTGSVLDDGEVVMRPAMSDGPGASAVVLSFSDAFFDSLRGIELVSLSSVLQHSAIHARNERQLMMTRTIRH
jgi:hypothetical protein